MYLDGHLICDNCRKLIKLGTLIIELKHESDNRLNKQFCDQECGDIWIARKKIK